MFELVIIIIVIFIFPQVNSVGGKVILFFLMILMIAPGIYSTLRGAPYLPTTKKRLETMLKLAQVNSKDRVVDLGCGDGRVIGRIADIGVKEAVGYEFSFPTYLVAILRKNFRGGKEKILFQNFWNRKFNDFDVVLCFLLETTMVDFEKKIWPHLKKGTRVVSNEFKMKNVFPDKEECGVCLYIKK